MKKSLAVSCRRAYTPIPSSFRNKRRCPLLIIFRGHRHTLALCFCFPHASESRRDETTRDDRRGELAVRRPVSTRANLYLQRGRDWRSACSPPLPGCYAPEAVLFVRPFFKYICPHLSAYADVQCPAFGIACISPLGPYSTIWLLIPLRFHFQEPQLQEFSFHFINYGDIQLVCCPTRVVL